MLARQLPGVELVSRGVSAPQGAPACTAARSWLRRSGVDLSSHESCRLTADDVRASTLVLTATAEHRDAVLDLHPPAEVRTHTLAVASRSAQWLTRETAVPEGDDVSERVLWLAEMLDRYRDAAPLDEGSLDVPDPHSGASHPAVFGLLADLVLGVSSAVTGGRRPPG